METYLEPVTLSQRDPHWHLVVGSAGTPIAVPNVGITLAALRAKIGTRLKLYRMTYGAVSHYLLKK